MIDSDLIELAQRQIALKIAEQDERLDADIGVLKAQFAPRGSLRSGGFVLAVQKLCLNATRERAEFAWKILHRCIATVGIAYDEQVEGQLKAVIDGCLPVNLVHVKKHLLEALSLIGMSALGDQTAPEVDRAREAAVESTFTEIKLFVMTLKKQPIEPSSYTPQTIVHIQHSTVGAVQTGGSSVANVQAEFHMSENAERLSDALDKVIQALATVDRLPQDDKNEILELATEAKAEIAKQKPNMSKLRSWLPVIGKSIEVVKDAYDVLKSAASAFGISLP